MRAESIHAFALIGLRALAECDPVEFNRTTDLTKHHLDARISELLEEVRDEREFRELQHQLDHLNTIARNSENQIASGFLLRQVSVACMQRAQSLALSYHRDLGESDQRDRASERGNAEVVLASPRSQHDEYLRLGVMRLLRDLPPYEALFNFRWRDSELDCVLRPLADEAPPILVEFKLRLTSVDQLRSAANNLRKASTGWDKSALHVILTVSLNREVRNAGAGMDKAFLLIYDPERDEFRDESAAKLVHFVLR